jgi:hypothetical protein
LGLWTPRAVVVDAKYGESGNSNRFDSEIVCTKIEIFEYLHKEFSNVTLENIERKTKLKRSSGRKERKKKEKEGISSIF